MSAAPDQGAARLLDFVCHNEAVSFKGGAVIVRHRLACQEHLAFALGDKMVKAVCADFDGALGDLLNVHFVSSGRDHRSKGVGVGTAVATA